MVPTTFVILTGLVFVQHGVYNRADSTPTRLVASSQRERVSHVLFGTELSFGAAVVLMAFGSPLQYNDNILYWMESSPLGWFIGCVHLYALIAPVVGYYASRAVDANPSRMSHHTSLGWVTTADMRSGTPWITYYVLNAQGSGLEPKPTRVLELVVV